MLRIDTAQGSLGFCVERLQLVRGLKLKRDGGDFQGCPQIALNLKLKP